MLNFQWHFNTRFLATRHVNFTFKRLKMLKSNIPCMTHTCGMNKNSLHTETKLEQHPLTICLLFLLHSLCHSLSLSVSRPWQVSKLSASTQSRIPTHPPRAGSSLPIILFTCHSVLLSIKWTTKHCCPYPRRDFLVGEEAVDSQGLSDKAERHMCLCFVGLLGSYVLVFVYICFRPGNLTYKP